MDPAGLQMQMRQNNEELVDYLKGLDNWEEEMREKDQTLVKNKSILKENLPPVRSSGSETKPKKQQQQKKKDSSKSSGGITEPKRIRSYDYQAWDKFDVDKACEYVDYEVQSSSGSEQGEEEEEGSEGVCGKELGESGEGGSEEEEEEEMKRQKKLAIIEKEKGNALYKEGKYESAVECYSHGIMLDPLSAALPANRAMALMKLERYAAVEADCSTALALDDSYVKAYLRRGVARRHLGKYTEAIQDFETVLALDTANKQGSSELKIVQQLKEDEERKTLVAQGHVFPVKRPAHLRSKRSLQRIEIDDIAGQVVETTDTSRDISAQSQDGNLTEKKEVHVHVDRRDSCSSHTSRTESTDNHTSPGVLRNSDQASIVNTSVNKSGEGVGITCSGSDSSPSVLQTPSTAAGGAECSQVEESPTTRNGVSDALPPTPETSFEFQCHWKQLRSSRPLLRAYFKRLSPSSYPGLLKQSLETDIFSDIISILTEEFTRSKVACINELMWLTRVARFSVAVMFLSKKDKTNLQSLFAGLLDTCTSDCDKETVNKLATDFNVKCFS